jgi:hypothetical protein
VDLSDDELYGNIIDNIYVKMIGDDNNIVYEQNRDESLYWVRNVNNVPWLVQNVVCTNDKIVCTSFNYLYTDIIYLVVGWLQELYCLDEDMATLIARQRVLNFAYNWCTDDPINVME